MSGQNLRTTSASFQQALAVLQSEPLRIIEQAVAARVGLRLLDDYSMTTTSEIQAEISAADLTVAEVVALLREQQHGIIELSVRILEDPETEDESEPEAHSDTVESSAAQTVERVGLNTGFGIRHALFYHYLLRRPPAELPVFLKARRIPHPDQYASHLHRLYDSFTEAGPLPA